MGRGGGCGASTDGGSGIAPQQEGGIAPQKGGGDTPQQGPPRTSVKDAGQDAGTGAANATSSAKEDSGKKGAAKKGAEPRAKPKVRGPFVGKEWVDSAEDVARCASEALPTEPDWDDISAYGPRNQVQRLRDLAEAIAPSDQSSLPLATTGTGIGKQAAALSTLLAALLRILQGIGSSVENDTSGFMCAEELARIAAPTVSVFCLCSAAPE
ncbi:hypothetical protein T484DRAFT_1888687, partial [Baffinella frigidus]